MRIIIMTDSLGRARPDLNKDSTHYDDIYFSLLRKKLLDKKEVEITLLTYEGIDTDMAIEQSKKSVAFRDPDIVIYHLGINDCSPRIFKKGARPLIHRKWFARITRGYFSMYVKRNRRKITKRKKLVYVKPTKFISNIQKMKNEVLKYSPNAIFYHVAISESFDWMNQRSYGHTENVKKYNTLLKKEYEDNFIDINLLVPDVDERLIHDGIHFTKNAHKVLSEELYNIIISQL